MKAETAERQYRSNMTGTAVRMKVAEGAEAHIMDILTKMYGDPELACIREYSTNARDSHIEAGQTRPIEVTLPTPYLPTLTIRDYGIGLDAQGIIELYSQYGASTKRDTNSAQGMLGIGCKSALAYTDQFTITGWKDGVQTVVVVSRDEDGAATQRIVSEAPDGETPTGVEVTIPVKQDNDMRDKATTFFSFWPADSVLVNGEKPRMIGSDNEAEDEYGDQSRNIWLDDRTLLTNEVSEDLVVMGYVAYPLVEGMADLFTSPRTRGSRYVAGRGYVQERLYNAVCFVDIGDVNFAPSRESLMATKRTEDRLEKLRTDIKTMFDASVRANIENAANAKEAQELLIAGREMGFDDSASPAMWNGREVLLSLRRGKKVKMKQVDGTEKEVISYSTDEWSSEDCLAYSYLFAHQTSYTRKNGERGINLDLAVPQTIFVNFDTKWLTNVKRAKLELWARDEEVSLGKIVLLDKLTKAEKFWLDGWQVFDWADVEAVELPKTTTADGTTVRLRGSYEGFVFGDRDGSIPAGKIDTTKPLYYVHGNYWAGSSNRAIRSGAISLKSCTLICLAANRIEKFKRDFPMAVEIHEAAKEAAHKWADKIDRDQVKAHALKQTRAAAVLQSLKGEDFDDPTLNTLIRLATTDSSRYESGLDKYGAYLAPEDASAVRKLAGKMQEKYPLAPWEQYGKPSGKQKDHLILYINAAIAANRKEA